MKDNRVYLLHVRDAIKKIQDYTPEGRDAFFADGKTQDAVIRNLEIIGEAVKHISPSLTTSHHHIPWKQIAGMRDRLIHAYFSVDLDLVWEVVVTELPDLQKTIKSLLDNLNNQH